jgi:hypothetical protein
LKPFDRDCSGVIPWALYEQLERNGGQPDLDWTRGAVVHACDSALYVLERLPVLLSEDCRPFCCLGNTVIFYVPGTSTEIKRVEYRPRIFPCVHFATDGDRVYEIVSGRVVYCLGGWRMEWYGSAATECARHFDPRRPCGEHCRPCLILGESCKQAAGAPPGRERNEAGTDAPDGA